MKSLTSKEVRCMEQHSFPFHLLVLVGGVGGGTSTFSALIKERSFQFFYCLPFQYDLNYIQMLQVWVKIYCAYFSYNIRKHLLTNFRDGILHIEITLDTHHKDESASKVEI